MNENKTPDFFQALSKVLEGYEVDDNLWLKVFNEEFQLLKLDYQVITLYYICMIYKKTKDWDEIEKLAKKGVDLALNSGSTNGIQFYHSNLLELLGIVAWHKGDPQKAEQLLLEALSIEPKRAPELYQRLTVLMFMKKDAPRSVKYLLALFNTEGFEKYAKDNFSLLGDLFNIAFLSFQDGSLSKDDFGKDVIGAWKILEGIWSQANPRDSDLAKIRNLAKPFMESSKCFIATACCGVQHSIWLDQLISFRDQRLKSNRFGRLMIGLYEQLSPFAANWLHKSSLLRAIIRYTIVAPIVFFLKFMNAKNESAK